MQAITVNDKQSLEEREHELELESVGWAQEAIDQRIDKRGFVDGSSTARKSLSNTITLTANRIQEWRDDEAQKRRRSLIYPHLLILGSEQLAFIVGRALINQGFADRTSFTKLCGAVGRQVKDVTNYELFKRANKDLSDDLENRLKRQPSPVIAQRATVAAMNEAANRGEGLPVKGLSWGPADLISIGAILIQCFNEATGLFERRVLRTGKKSTAYLMPTVTMGLLLAQAEIRDCLIMPFRFPMIVKPLDWSSSLEDGGYLNQDLHALRLIKGDEGLATRLAATDTKMVRKAVNAIQSTPWRINTAVMDVFEEILERKIPCKGLSTGDQPSLVDQPWPKMKASEWSEWNKIPENKQALQEYRTIAKAAYEAHRKWCSQAVIQSQQIELARKFWSEEAIYFPHTVDWRGRVYPVAGCGSINPQGNDLGKSLLEFAHGKAIGPDGGKWLAIHLANTWGNDKVSFADRELWAELSTPWVLEVAADPITNTKWMEADKPFGFLAACFEWAKYIELGEDHCSHLPIAMDGSCSGLQHFGAMLLDEGTCEAVNVIQSGDVPADVYSVVLERVRKLIEESTDPMAKQWSTRLHRNIVKQPVMTSVYSVTQRGITNQVNQWVIKLIEKGDIEPFEGRGITSFKAAVWLSPLIIEALGDQLSAATQAMDWLKHACAVVSGTCPVCLAHAASFDKEEVKPHHCGGSPMEWITPTGFTVFQAYRELEEHKVTITWNGKPQQIRLRSRSTKIAPKKCVNGISANFVHSQDAAHLMLVANCAVDNKITDFAFVHDSFATHACNTGLLNEVLRECFIEQYRDDTLDDLYAQLQDQVSTEVFNKIEPPPNRGNMDLEAVRDSLYFFA